MKMVFKDDHKHGPGIPAQCLIQDIQDGLKIIAESEQLEIGLPLEWEIKSKFSSSSFEFKHTQHELAGIRIPHHGYYVDVMLFVDADLRTLHESGVEFWEDVERCGVSLYPTPAELAKEGVATVVEYRIYRMGFNVAYLGQVIYALIDAASFLESSMEEVTKYLENNAE